jgi:hypothetical protein
MKLNLLLLSAATLINAATAIETVDLGTAGDYVILAKTGISTVPDSFFIGDIAVSPIAAAAITGFDLIIDSDGLFSTASQLTGKAYAVDYASPSPIELTTAVGDMETAYTNAAESHFHHGVQGHEYEYEFPLRPTATPNAPKQRLISWNAPVARNAFASALSINERRGTRSVVSQKNPVHKIPRKSCALYTKHIDRMQVPAKLACGPVFARHLAQRLYRGSILHCKSMPTCGL